LFQPLVPVVLPLLHGPACGQTTCWEWRHVVFSRRCRHLRRRSGCSRWGRCGHGGRNRRSRSYSTVGGRQAVLVSIFTPFCVFVLFLFRLQDGEENDHAADEDKNEHTPQRNDLNLETGFIFCGIDVGVHASEGDLHHSVGSIADRF